MENSLLSHFKTVAILRIAVLIMTLALPAMGVKAQRPETLRGLATYYSAKMHGRRMSDGTLYDRTKFTCAHRTFPFGTMLKVTNLVNGKSTVVKVTDRGPFGRTNLIIDLSNSAAAQIDMLSAGIVEVEVEVLQTLEEIVEEHLRIKYKWKLGDFLPEQPVFPIQGDWRHSEPAHGDVVPGRVK